MVLKSPKQLPATFGFINLRDYYYKLNPDFLEDIDKIIFNKMMYLNFDYKKCVSKIKK
jgi:hypothetical protein